jgi:hypothetical protein
MAALKNFRDELRRDFPEAGLELREEPLTPADAVWLLQRVVQRKKREPRVAEALDRLEAYSAHIRGIADALGVDPVETRQKVDEVFKAASIAGAGIDLLALEGTSHVATAADVALNSTHAAAHAIDGFITAGAMVAVSLAVGGVLRGLTRKKRNELERLLGRAYWNGRLAMTLMRTVDMPQIQDAVRQLRRVSKAA